MLLFQVKILHLFMSPVVPVLAARLGIIPGSLLVQAALFVLSLFLGRAFCGWFCPGAGMQELLALVIHRGAGRGWGDRVKYAICGAWSVLILSMLFQAGGLPRVDVSFGTRSNGIVQEILMRTGHFVIIGVLGAIFGAWASCRYICWIAPFLVLGRRVRDFVRLPGLRQIVFKIEDLLLPAVAPLVAGNTAALVTKFHETGVNPRLDPCSHTYRDRIRVGPHLDPAHTVDLRETHFCQVRS